MATMRYTVDGTVLHRAIGKKWVATINGHQVMFWRDGATWKWKTTWWGEERTATTATYAIQDAKRLLPKKETTT